MYVHDIAIYSSVQVMLTNDEELKPVYWGTGFILDYNGRGFFVTVRHVATYQNLTVYLETNLPSDESTTPIQPLGGFCYFDLFNVDDLDKLKSEEDFKELIDNPDEKIDIAFAEIKSPITLLQPETDFGAFIIKAGSKLPLFIQDIAIPDKEHDYMFYGKIKQEYNGIYLISTPTLKHNIKYNSTVGRFHRFLAPEIRIVKDEYEGTSGAPILDSEGRLVAIACKVYSGTKVILGFPIQECIKLLDMALKTGML